MFVAALKRTRYQRFRRVSEFNSGWLQNCVSARKAMAGAAQASPFPAGFLTFETAFDHACPALIKNNYAMRVIIC